MVLHNVGGVKCQPVYRCSYHWRWALQNGAVCFGFSLVSRLPDFIFLTVLFFPPTIHLGLVIVNTVHLDLL